MKKLKLLLVFIFLVCVANQTSFAQYYHYLKGLERCVEAANYKDTWYLDKAFNEWEEGHDAGEFASAMMLAHCYMVERGTTRNLSKATSIIESWIPRNPDALVFAAYHWLPRDDFWTNEQLYESLCQEESEYGTLRYYFGIRDRRAADYGGVANFSKSFKYANTYLAKNPQNEYYVKLCKEIVGFGYLLGLGGVEVNFLKALNYLSEERVLWEINKVLSVYKEKDGLKGKIKELLPVLKKVDLDKLLTSDDVLEVSAAIGSADGAKKKILTHYLTVGFPVFTEFEAWISENDPVKNPKSFLANYENLSPAVKQLVLDKTIELVLDINGPAMHPDILSFAYFSVKDEWTDAKRRIADMWCSYVHYDFNHINDPEHFIKTYDEFLQTHIASSLEIDGRKMCDLSNHSDYKIEERLESFMLSLGIIEDRNKFELLERFPDGSRFVTDLEKVCEHEKIYYPRFNSYLLFDVDGKAELLGVKNTKYYLEIESVYERLAALPAETRDYVIREKGLSFDGYFAAQALFEIFDKETKGTIQVSDYDEYLEKYKSSHYARYCSEARLMLIADACTKSTPKEEIKELVSSAYYKETKKYIKTVIKTNKKKN